MVARASVALIARLRRRWTRRKDRFSRATVRLRKVALGLAASRAVRRPRRMALRRIRKNHPRALLANHDRRRVGMSANDCGHDGRVDHAQPIDAADAKSLIDDGHVILAHPARADGMIERLRSL